MYFVNVRTSYQENRYLQYIDPLSDHTLIMVTLFMTKLIIPLSIKNWNHFNTIPRIAAQFVVLGKKKFIMNKAWNHFKIGDGIENYPSYTKLLLTNPLHIFLT